MTTNQEVDAKGKDRRSTPRVGLSIPVTLRPVEDSPFPELQVESINMSHLGIYFASKVDIPEGTKVEMRFSMPERFTGKKDNYWRCIGRVIRVDRNRQPSGNFGVGVRFDYYELIAA